MYVLNVAITHHQIFTIFCHSHYAFVYIERNENKFDLSVMFQFTRCDAICHIGVYVQCACTGTHTKSNYFDRFVEFMSSNTKNLC